MNKLLYRIISIGIAVVMIFAMTILVFAASNSSYVEGNQENIVITFEKLRDSTYEVKIRNDRENTIGKQ